MDQVSEDDGFDWEKAVKLEDFLTGPQQPLSAEERQLIVAQSTRILQDYYVHLPEKMALHHIDPLGELGALRGRAGGMEELDFHRELCGIFAKLRDLHTQYSLPSCYQHAVALLPFKLGVYARESAACYVVTARLPTYPWGDTEFKEGAEILTWCGEPIDEVVKRAADSSGGASEEARKARALAALTMSPMERQPPPAPSSVALTYRTRSGDHDHAATFSYRVVQPPVEPPPEGWQPYVQVDHEHELRRRASKHAYRSEIKAAERQAREGKLVRAYDNSDTLKTRLPTVLEARSLCEGRYGYLRIHSFHAPADQVPPDITKQIDQFVGECARLLEALPKQGLVLDVRGNPGGMLPLAESLLQLFTPRRITPQSLQLRATQPVLELTKQSDYLTLYLPSLQQAIESGGYSAAFPLTKPDWCNNHGQTYHGPVVLIVDARCYSATDAFAAGFQDHEIGPVLGVAPSTGGGGGNVWRMSDFPSSAGLDRELPGGAGLRVALRRMLRVAPREGMLTEEVGVEADHRHETTQADLLENDRDLLEHAASLLQGREWYRLDASFADGCLELSVRGIDTVRMTCGDFVCSQVLP